MTHTAPSRGWAWQAHFARGVRRAEGDSWEVRSGPVPGCGEGREGAEAEQQGCRRGLAAAGPQPLIVQQVLREHGLCPPQCLSGRRLLWPKHWTLVLTLRLDLLSWPASQQAALRRAERARPGVGVERLPE